MAMSTRYNTDEDTEANQIRIMSWNIDGLDQKNKQLRVEGVCNEINKKTPHVVLLQEVVMEMQEILERKCPSYSLFSGGENNYYTAILLRRDCTVFEDKTITAFPSSTMFRNLLSIKCTVKGIKFDIVTSHLESTRPATRERKRQLKTAFENVKQSDANRTVIFGGDLNLRDKELDEIQGIPNDVYDVWEVTGKRPEVKFTWDMERNDNLEWGFEHKPKCRFDRMYIRHCRPHAKRSLLAFSREREKKPFFPFDSKPKPDGNCSSEGIAEILKRLDFTEDSEPDTIRLMSWNIDGRHSEYLSERVQGVCDTIRIKEPHVVLLQEVVFSAQKILEEKCPSYDLVKSGYKGNYLAILLRRGFATFEKVEVTDFFNSSQHRKLLNVKCTIKGIKFDILTTHLETTKRNARERKRQLMLSFDRVELLDIDRTVIFGGDLCIRDNEIAEIDGVPEDFDDIWEVTGMKPEAKFTWDTLYNDNLEYGNNEFRFAYDPRFRFDRLYIRHCKPKATVQPVDFELVGLERLPSCQTFPSDHWGLLIHFNVPS